MNMMKHIKNDDGHYIVEASIILPFVLALVIAIGCMCRTAGIKENIVHSSADEMRIALINSYIYGTDFGLDGRLEKRLTEENPSIRDLHVSGFRSGFSRDGYDELIKIDVKFRVDIDSPIPLESDPSEKMAFVGRKFIGRSDNGEPFGFDDMEKSEDADTVYIFPKDGERYHKKECSYVTPEAVKKVLSDTLRNKYGPCEACDTQKMDNGSTVYIFEAYGNKYHKKNCSTIEKHVVAADRSVAEEKGYSPCEKCGG